MHVICGNYPQALAPGTHVESHYGPTNKKLRCHFPLVVPKNCEEPCAWLRVATERLQLQEGKCIVFDDSFEHEAGNDHPTEPRVVLIIDIWHPELTEEEVRTASNCQLTLIVLTALLAF